MVDVKQIHQTLLKNFNVFGPFTIDPNTGVVDVKGELHISKKMDKLPVTFGTVTGPVYFQGAGLTSLVGSPRRVTSKAQGGGFYCPSNQLTNLMGAPKTVNGTFICHHNPLTTLEGHPVRADGWVMEVNPDTPLLRLLVIKNLKQLRLWMPNENKFHPAQDIILKYMPYGKAGLLNCSLELKKAGYPGNARW